MSEKTRYFKIGLFTFMALGLLVFTLILFGLGSLFDAPPIVVETYFNSSVQGLDIGAPVKLKGVKVGKVKDILFVKDVYGKDRSLKDLGTGFVAVYVKLEIESKFFPNLPNMDRDAAQATIDSMVKNSAFRTKLESIGITGLSYVELGFYDPAETPDPSPIYWKPEHLYIPSAPGVVSRLGESVDKLLNKMDSDVYPMLENLSKISKDLPVMTTKLNETLSHTAVISKNIEDITSTGKKYPAQILFGEAPPKSRYDA